MSELLCKRVFLRLADIDLTPEGEGTPESCKIMVGGFKYQVQHPLVEIVEQIDLSGSKAHKLPALGEAARRAYATALISGRGQLTLRCIVSQFALAAKHRPEGIEITMHAHLRLVDGLAWVPIRRYL